MLKLCMLTQCQADHAFLSEERGIQQALHLHGCPWQSRSRLHRVSRASDLPMGLTRQEGRGNHTWSHAGWMPGPRWVKGWARTRTWNGRKQARWEEEEDGDRGPCTDWERQRRKGYSMGESRESWTLAMELGLWSGVRKEGEIGPRTGDRPQKCKRKTKTRGEKQKQETQEQKFPLDGGPNLLASRARNWCEHYHPTHAQQYPCLKSSFLTNMDFSSFFFNLNKRRGKY